MHRNQQLKDQRFGKLTGEEPEAELDITEEHRTQGEEHVNWEQENKEEDSGAIGTDQV